MARRSGATTFVLALVILGGVCELPGQELQIGIIDFYGLNRISARQAREALTFKEGDIISLEGNGPPAFLAESERRLSNLPGIAHARTNIVCCDAGRAIVFVGIEEKGAAVMRLRAAPRGRVRLAADVVQAGDEFSEAFMAAIQRGDVTEDRSQGHAFNHDPTSRAIQQRFVGYAARDLANLRRVLRDSSEARQRALAAQVLGYVSDKQAVVSDLVHAMSDPFDDVRNNAMRALLVFAETSVRPVPRIPYQPFIAFLQSPVWTDRNKASGALMELSTNRDPQLLARLQRDAIAPLMEMARLKSAAHALAAFMILGRIAGYSDEALRTTWDRGEREVVLNAVLDRH